MSEGTACRTILVGTLVAVLTSPVFKGLFTPLGSISVLPGVNRYTPPGWLAGEGERYRPHNRRARPR